MGEWLSSWLPLNFIVVNLELSGKHFSQLAKICVHSTCGHNCFVGHLHKFWLVSCDDAVSFREPRVTTNNYEVLAGNSNNSTAIVYIWIELVSSVFNVWMIEWKILLDSLLLSRYLDGSLAKWVLKPFGWLSPIFIFKYFLNYFFRFQKIYV